MIIINYQDIQLPETSQTSNFLIAFNHDFNKEIIKLITGYQMSLP